MFGLTYDIDNFVVASAFSRSNPNSLPAKQKAVASQNHFWILLVHQSLVGGLEHVLVFHIYIYILGIIIPTDFHIFQRG
jgi:hypothetical protein